MLLLRKYIYIFLLTVFLCFPAPQSYALDDAILAVVNDELITLTDLKEYIKGVFVSLAADGIPEDKIQEIKLDLEINGLNKLIEDKLVISRAAELGIQVKDKLIDDRIETIKKRYPDDDTFMKALEMNGGTMSDLHKKITEQLQMQFTIEHEVRSKIYVNPQEITSFYQDNLNKFQTKEKVKLNSIYMSFDENKDLVMKKANVALELLENGEEFTDIAKEYSETPPIGTVERGQLIPAIEKEIFHLQKNIPSDLVETDQGVYIFLLEERIPQELAPLNEVKGNIENRLFSEKFKEELTKWVAKLKKNAYIEIKQ